MLNLKKGHIAIITLFVILLGVISGGYVLRVNTANVYTGIIFPVFIVALFLFSIIIYILVQLPQYLKNIFMSLLITAAYIIMLGYIKNFPKFNADSSVYLIFSLITILFGITDGLISVVYGSFLLLLRAYISSQPVDPYIFYAVISTFVVVIIGLGMNYEKKTIKKLQNKITTFQETPVEFSIKPAQNDTVQYSDVISNDGLKREKNKLTMVLNQRLYDIVETIRSTIHPFTVILYLMDNNMNLRGREVLSNSEWISMDKPLKPDDPYIGWILKNKKSLLLNEIKNEIKDIPYYTRNEGIKSFVAVPAVRYNNIIGIICADSLEVQAFTDEHIRLLTVIGNQIMDLIDNIELQYKMRYNMHEKGAMYTFVKTLSRHINASDIGQTALYEIVRITGANAGIFAVKDDKKTFKAVAIYNINNGLIGKSFVADAKLSLNNAEENQLSSINQIPTSQTKLLYPSLHSLYEPDKIFKYTAIISLKGKNKEVGLIFLFMKNTLDKRISIIIDTLINQVAISLYNSVLFNTLEKLAITDGLTGLHNHRHFQEYIDGEAKEASRYNNPLAFIILDIDHFKVLNDTYGHPQGDMILKKLSEVILQTIRDVDYAARYGGEEFCIVLPNTNLKGAYKTAERLRKKVEALSIRSDNDKSIKFTVSIGISTLLKDAENKHQLISHADEALYFSKENGRNQTTIYNNISLKERKL